MVREVLIAPLVNQVEPEGIFRYKFLQVLNSQLLFPVPQVTLLLLSSLIHRLEMADQAVSIMAPKAVVAVVQQPFKQILATQKRVEVEVPEVQMELNTSAVAVGLVVARAVRVLMKMVMMHK